MHRTLLTSVLTLVALSGAWAVNPPTCSAEDGASALLGRFMAKDSSAPSKAQLCLGVRTLIPRWIGAQIRRIQANSPASDADLRFDDVVIVVGYEHNGTNEIKVIGRAPGCMSLPDAVAQATSPPFEMIVVRNGELVGLRAELKECDQHSDAEAEVEVST